MEKIIGILGGMGPEATVDLMHRIIQLTPAEDDADHIRCIVDNNPKVPSRIKAIIEKTGEAPGPCMAEMGRRLEAYGADILAIACNTAHYYYDDVQNAVKIPVIHMIDEVCAHVAHHFPDQEKIGILASPAVAITRLYTKRFDAINIQDIWPEPDMQNRLLEIIKQVKKGDTGNTVRSDFQQICLHLKSKGVKTAIIACTELSALNCPLAITTVDAADILARVLVKTVKHGY